MMLSFIKNKALRILTVILFFSALIYLTLRFLPVPGLDDFLNSPYSLKVTDRDGRILQILPLNDGSRREFVSVKNTPEFLKKIFIKSEDKRFYYHFGIDPVALARSIFLNNKFKRTVSGASTITMQLARIISPHSTGYKGKLLEMFYAVLLEARFSKNKILELWLNSIPYGYRTTGITTAAKTFFNKNLESLSSGEALALAVLPRSPEKYNPFSGKKELKDKTFELAGRIGFNVTADEIEKDLSDPKQYTWEDNAFHFINYIKNLISHKDYISGESINSSLDLELNEKLEERIRFYLNKYSSYRVSNGALIAIDNRTGEIISYIGSNDFNDKEKSGEIDGVQITNQPGSTLKPFLYALALENGYTPASILPDIPLDFGEENLYFPLNFSRRFNGPVRLRVALASSLNVPAVYLVTKIGVQNFTNKLIDIEFDSLKKQRNFIGSGIALGNAEVSLMELARAFSIFPRAGQFNNLTFKKENSKNFKKGKSFFSEYTSLMICNILSDNSSRILGFGRNSALNTNFPAMFKTGTSNQFNNVWAIGATPDYTVGVWIGNFSGETVIGQVGNSIPAFICIEALTMLSSVNEKKEFPLPANINERSICPLSGQTAKEICPSNITEFFRNQDTLTECEYHIKNGSKVVENYPPFYTGWLAKNKKEIQTFEDQSESAYPKITRPNNHAVFFLDPNIPLNNQAIRIEIINNDPKESLNININGVYEKTISYPYLYYFQLKKGNWQIEIKGKKSKDQIEIIVK